MSEQNRSLEGIKSENDLRARFETERRENRACAIENLECLAILLDRLPAHDFCGYQMSGSGNFPSDIIRVAVETLKKNN